MTDDTKNPGGWPGALGVPENPERDGWHWVTYRGEETPRARFWFADDTGWGFGLPADEPHLCRYEGPILFPAEVAARVAEAREEGRLSAILDAPTQPLDDPQWDATDAAHPAWWRGNDHGVAAVVQIINGTLDGKPPGTYGSADLTSAIRRVAEARADGMREAGVTAEIAAERKRQIEEEGWTPEHDDAHTAGEIYWASWGIDARLNQASALPASDPRRRKLMIQAAALLVAEIERQDRAAAIEKKEPTT